MADVYSNRDKLLAVVEFWSRPLMAQLPTQLSLLSPVLLPVLKNAMMKIPDAAIPQAANAIVDNAVRQGGVQIWKIHLDQSDVAELQRLIRLNLPCESADNVGYSVITN